MVNYVLALYSQMKIYRSYYVHMSMNYSIYINRLRKTVRQHKIFFDSNYGAVPDKFLTGIKITISYHKPIPVFFKQIHNPSKKLPRLFHGYHHIFRWLPRYVFLVSIVTYCFSKVFTRRLSSVLKEVFQCLMDNRTIRCSFLFFCRPFALYVSLIPFHWTSKKRIYLGIRYVKTFHTIKLLI